MNLIIPMTSLNRFSSNNHYYPKPLVEINGKSMLQNCILDYEDLNCKYYPIINKEDCKKYNLDNTLKRLLDKVPHNIKQLSGNTSGSLCTSMLVMDEISDNEEILIINYDQKLLFDINKPLEYFKENNADYGVIGFESTHPKWSYVRVSDDNVILESQEKNPISKNALTGLYYFKNKEVFLNAAMKCIIEAPINKKMFYLSDVINYCVLQNCHGYMYKIDSDEYIKYWEEEDLINEQKNKFKINTKKYFKYLNKRNYSSIEKLLSDDCVLYENKNLTLHGKDSILSHIGSLLLDKKVNFYNLEIMNYNNIVLAKFNLDINNNVINIIDEIVWDDNKISSIKVYMHGN